MQQCVCIGCTCQIFVGSVYIGVNYMFVQCAHDVCLCVCVHIHVNLCVLGKGMVDHPAGSLPMKH